MRDGQPHLRGPRQRPRAGPAGARLRGDRPRRPAAARVPAPAPRLGGRPRLLPDRGHAQDDAGGRGASTAASATATASPSARATTSTSTRPRTRRGRSRSSTAPSAGRSAAGLGDAKTLAPEALRCTPDRPGARGPRRPVAPGGDPRRSPRAPSRAADDRRASIADAGYPGVRDWPVVAFTGTPPGDAIAWEAAGTDRVGTTIVDRYRLHHSGGLVIPLLHVRRAGAPRGNVLVRLGLEGKIRPADWPEVEARLAEGHEVVSFDPRGLGETRMRYRATSVDDPELAPADEEAAYASPLSGVLANHVYNAQLLGRPYLFELIEDVEIAVRFARGRLGAREVAIDAPGEARLLARAAAAALPGRGARRAPRRRAVLLLEGGRRVAAARPGPSTTSCPGARRCARRAGGARHESPLPRRDREHQHGLRGVRPRPRPRGRSPDARAEALALRALGRGSPRGPRRPRPRSTGRRRAAGTPSWTSSPTRRRRWRRRSSAFAGRTGQYVFIGTAAAYDKPNARLPITEDAPAREPVLGVRAAQDRVRGARAARRTASASCRSRSCGPPTPTARRGSRRASAGRTTRWSTACAAACPVVCHGDGTALWGMTHSSDFAVGLVGLLGRPEAIGEAFHVTTDEVLTWNADLRDDRARRRRRGPARPRAERAHRRARARPGGEPSRRQGPQQRLRQREGAAARPGVPAAGRPSPRASPARSRGSTRTRRVAW